MDTKKIIIISAVLALIAAVMYFLFRKPTETQPVIDSAGKLTKADAGVTENNTENFPLSQGMEGPNIKRLQTALNWIAPANKIDVDGQFGSFTYGKLLRTVDTTLSRTPITEQNFNTIIALGNQAKGA